LYPNQGTQGKSAQRTPSQSGTKAKPTTLAGAFEKSNDQKYGFLKNHINWEKQKFKQMEKRESDRFEWEKE
jgi:hypothetical protein